MSAAALGHAALRIGSWLLLAGWVGSWATFAFGIAPLAFRVLPPGSAGELVAPLLSGLHVYGLGAGLGLAVLAPIQKRGIFATIWPLALAAACAYTEFVVTAGIEAAGVEAFGRAPTPEAAQSFATLHTRSQWIFGAVWLGSLALLALHAVQDAPGGRGEAD